METAEKFKIQTYSKSELARLYRISVVTLMIWIEPIRADLSLKRYAKNLNPKQVTMIVELLGEPEL